jgi:hypothetical protein
VSNRRRYLVGLGLAVVITAVIVVVVSSRGNDDSVSASKPPIARRSTRTEPAANWVAEANAVCRLGRKLYPNIVLGAAGDPDTIDYAVGRLVTEIAAITPLPPRAGRHALALHGQAAVDAWHSLATKQEETVTSGEKQEAARSATRYVDQLVALGAGACAPLRPSTA